MLIQTIKNGGTGAQKLPWAENVSKIKEGIFKTHCISH